MILQNVTEREHRWRAVSVWQDKAAWARALVAVAAIVLAGCAARPSKDDGSGLPVPVVPTNVTASKRLAVEGYDVVSYFDGKPQRGSKEFNAVNDGVNYWFVSAAHRDLFASNPERYKPAYGGWCATAMANGDRVDVEPTNYRITDGRLYLFFKFGFIDARGAWDDDPAALRLKADQHWSKALADSGAGS